MKSVTRYVFAAGMVTLAVLMLIFYREYLGEDADPATEKQTNPLINMRLHAIVTATSASKAPPHIIPGSLKIVYTDIDTKEAAGFLINYRSQPNIAIGDTLTKDKGEKLLLVYKKGGRIVSVPIE